MLVSCWVPVKLRNNVFIQQKTADAGNMPSTIVGDRNRQSAILRCPQKT